VTRRERLRDYWNSRLPPFEHCSLGDAERFINRSQKHKLVSYRSLRRKALQGELPASGGYDRSIRHYRIYRVDLIEWLIDQDLITGNEPPEPRPRSASPEPPKTSPPAHPVSARRPPKPRHIGQRSLFEE
jgi:hypothetical protein